MISEQAVRVPATDYRGAATMLKRTAETAKAAVSGHQRQRPRRPINEVLTADSGRCGDTENETGRRASINTVRMHLVGLCLT